MKLKRHIPNLITLLNLFCGCIAVVHATNNELRWTAVFVLLGIGFDFLDGLMARILKVQSELGLQLDSLADMVTSGLVPGIVMCQLLAKTYGVDLIYIFENSHDFVWKYDRFMPLLGLLITLASAYRLAKFNIDTRQTSSFIGLPTPANTLLMISLPFILSYQNIDWVSAVLSNTWFLVGLTCVSCYMLNAEIPLFALKFKTWGFAKNKVRYVFLVLAIVLIVFLKFIAIPCVIFLYVLMSLIFKENNIKT